MRIAAKRRAEWRLGDPFVEGSSVSVDRRGRSRDVVEVGDRNGEPIVLVPGMAGGRDLLTPLIHKLAKRYRVILPSLRGDHGPLGLDPAREMSDLAEDLASTIDGLALERPIVMGVSFGGAVALEFAVEHPESLGGLVLWGAEARFRPTLASTVARRTLERFPVPADNPFLNQFFNLLHAGRPEPGPLTDFVVERCWRTDQSVIAHRLGLLESFDVTDRLWRIDAPTLVLSGSRDVVVPPARQRALAQSISGASHVEVAGAGHIGFLTHRDEVAAGLGQFVRKLRGSYC